MRAQQELRTGDVDDLEDQLRRAREIVGLTVAACGPEDINVSRAINNLALLQVANGDFESAIENFQLVIAARESKRESMVTASLLNPLMGLAEALVTVEAAQAAIEIYERAIHITHVNDGPGNVEQVPIIDALAAVYEGMGSRGEADRLANLRFRLLERYYEPTSDQYFDALEQRAKWADRYDNDSQATYAYNRLIERMGERYGEDSPLLIEPLMAFATVSIGRRTGRYARTEQGLLQEARRAIKRAESIARDNADSDPTVLPRMLILKGDWMQYIGSRRRARDLYAEAWTLLSTTPELVTLRNELLGMPLPIYKGEIYDIYDRPDTQDVDLRNYPEQGFVDLTYRIDEMGKPSAVEVTNSEPAGLMDEYVTTRLQSYIYRPQFRDGEPVAYDRVISFRHEFRYNRGILTPSERERIRRSAARRTAGGSPSGESNAATPDASGS